MTEDSPSPTLNLRERPLAFIAANDRLPKWLTVSLLVHAALIVSMFAVSILPSTQVSAPPVYTVDLIGGEKIGKANLGTEVIPTRKVVAKQAEPQPAPPPVPEKKSEPPAKAEAAEKTPPAKEAAEPKAKKPQEPVKIAKEPVQPAAAKDSKNEAKAEALSADSVRERLIHAAAERAKNKTETAQKDSTKETLSFGAGEGEGAASLGTGGRGGAGIVKGLDFIIYQNRMLSTIKNNWAWVGQRASLKVVVQFGIKDNGEIVGLKIVQTSGDATYDESVLRAVKKSNPLPAPPIAYRKDFAEVELTFRPRDLGA